MKPAHNSARKPVQRDWGVWAVWAAFMLAAYCAAVTAAWAVYRGVLWLDEVVG